VGGTSQLPLPTAARAAGSDRWPGPLARAREVARALLRAGRPVPPAERRLVDGGVEEAVGAEAEEDELAAVGTGDLAAVGSAALHPAEVTDPVDLLTGDVELTADGDVDGVGRVPMGRAGSSGLQPDDHAEVAAVGVD